MFTVASMFKHMQDLCVSFPVYIPGQDGNDTGSSYMFKHLL